MNELQEMARKLAADTYRLAADAIRLQEMIKHVAERQAEPHTDTRPGPPVAATYFAPPADALVIAPDDD